MMVGMVGVEEVTIILIGIIILHHFIHMIIGFHLNVIVKEDVHQRVVRILVIR
jgi:hypothetical protein